MELVKQAVELDPKAFKAHYVLGRLLPKAGLAVEEVRELEIDRGSDPNCSALRYLLTGAYNALNQPADAKHEKGTSERLRQTEDVFRQTGIMPADFSKAPEESSLNAHV
ncbi:MAG: hypothetical protein ABSC08_02985 [Bryobacteraceae bacterium]